MTPRSQAPVSQPTASQSRPRPSRSPLAMLTSRGAPHAATVAASRPTPVALRAAAAPPRPRRAPTPAPARAPRAVAAVAEMGDLELQAPVVADGGRAAGDGDGDGGDAGRDEGKTRGGAGAVRWCQAATARPTRRPVAARARAAPRCADPLPTRPSPIPPNPARRAGQPRKSRPPRPMPDAADAIPRDAFARGQVVVGRVLSATPAGARVALVDDARVIGFCPARELTRSPAAVAGTGEAATVDLAPGDVREFVIMYVPAAAAYGGLGPALSAVKYDDGVRWARAAAVAAAGGAVTVEVVGANAGGLLATLAGLPAFMPYSQVDAAALGLDAPPGEDGRRPRLDAAVAAGAVGARVRALVTTVDRAAGKIVLSPRAAAAADARASLAVGALVWGTVRKVAPYGVFVGVDGTTESALLHVSNTSRARVGSPADVFAVGDRVRALVVGMDGDGRRLSLSTAEVEAADGDMLRDPAAVYEGADEQAGVFRAHLQALAQREAEEGGGGGGGRGGRRE